MAWSSTSMWGKVALVCTLLGTLLFVIGFSTTSWYTPSDDNSSSMGLWQTCSKSGCFPSKHAFAGSDDPDWFQAVQAMECLGLIFAVFTTIIVVLIVFVESIAANKNAAYASVAFAFLTTLCIMIGVAIFGHKISYSIFLGYSYALASGASIIFSVDTAMCALNARRSTY